MTVINHSPCLAGGAVQPGGQVSRLSRADAVSVGRTHSIVGMNRGVAVSGALSTGGLSSVLGPRDSEAKRLLRLRRRPAYAAWGTVVPP